MDLFKDLGTVPRDKALEGRGAQESWLKFKDDLLQTQEFAFQQRRSQAETSGDLHGLIRRQTQTQKASLERVEARKDNLGRI